MLLFSNIHAQRHNLFGVDMMVAWLQLHVGMLPPLAVVLRNPFVIKPLKLQQQLLVSALLLVKFFYDNSSEARSAVVTPVTLSTASNCKPTSCKHCL